MNKIFILSAILVVGSFAQLNSQTFQALKHTEGEGYNIGNWDGSQIKSKNGDVLTTITIKNSKIDFSRAAGQTRLDLLKSLYKAGTRGVYISSLPEEQFLVILPEGYIGPAEPQNGLFQALAETDDGFDLNTFEHSSIIDSNGKVLVSLTLRDKKVTLSIPTGQSIDTLYKLGLRSFFTKVGQVVELVIDDQGKVVLMEK
jgi:hypothetical protein